MTLKVGQAAPLKVGMHSTGYVAETSRQAADEYYPGFAKAIASVAEERGFGEMTRDRFDSQLGPYGAMLVGDSVRGSLRDLVNGRLGETRAVISSTSFFRDKLADSFPGSAPMLVLVGYLGPSLLQPDYAAARVLAYLRRDDFGSNPVADIRE